MVKFMFEVEHFLLTPWSDLALMGKVTVICDGYRKYSALGLVVRLRGNGGLRDLQTGISIPCGVVLSHARWGSQGSVVILVLAL